MLLKLQVADSKKNYQAIKLVISILKSRLSRFSRMALCKAFAYLLNDVDG